jgi:hypothetical protein
MARAAFLSVAACLLCSITSTTWAGEFAAILSDEFAELSYARDAGFVGLEEGRAEAGLLLTEDNTIIVHGTLDFPVLTDATPVELAVGTRLYLAGLVEPGDDIMGIGFGAAARYRLPLDRVPVLNRFPFYIAASIYYSPEVTTSGAGTDILDIHLIRGELELSENVLGLVGLRTLDVDRGVGEEDIVDERLYVGLRVQF